MDEVNYLITYFALNMVLPLMANLFDNRINKINIKNIKDEK